VGETTKKMKRVVWKEKDMEKKKERRKDIERGVYRMIPFENEMERVD
jgi:hypothetical protein